MHALEGHELHSPPATKEAPSGLLFHEYWWLSAATKDQFSEVEVKHNGRSVGRLPFVLHRKCGLRIVRMPPYTHLLGPAIDSGDGKSQTRLMKRLSIVRSLIGQLPPFDYFKQAIETSTGDGLALCDGLAFQEYGFQINPQYTFQIEPRYGLDAILSNMHFKVRQHIRRAAEKYTVVTIDDPDKFIDFYIKNLRRAGRRSYVRFDNFPALYSSCRARNCGEILAAVDKNDNPVAMNYLVWDSIRMYYLLSTRTSEISDDNGSASLLIWSGIGKAHERGLVFDFDGVSTRGIARFYQGFGGQIKTRQIITASRFRYRMLRHLNGVFDRDDTTNFT
jgi:hypothetical protein